LAGTAQSGAYLLSLSLWERVAPHEVRRRVRGCLRGENPSSGVDFA
jgi:hypothetical protein